MKRRRRSFLALKATALAMAARASGGAASSAIADEEPRAPHHRWRLRSAHPPRRAQGGSNDVAAPAVVPADTLTDQILCGYQGWFAYPNDGSPLNRWKHWFSSHDDPSAEHLHIDMYPKMDEYDDEDLQESNLRMRDGSYAKKYSTSRPNVVLKHFEWMRDYGISGVFHMRFMEGLDRDANREWKTNVLRNVRDAAESTGRVFAVSYNIAGRALDNSVLDDLKEDWKRLVDEEQITNSDRYLHHEGRPVLRIFGIGFKSVQVTNLEKLAGLIEWLQNPEEERYRVFLVGGVPSHWRGRTKDARTNPAWRGIYDSLDGIHPWHVGRWKTINGFQRVYNRMISRDARYCNERNILYMPTMWPGFSWHNQKKARGSHSPVNVVPRLGGRFLWAQAYRYAADPNIRTIWMAQFDEVDEGTAIYKVATDQSEVPAEGTWLTLDADGESLPSDWYLRLCGAAQRMLRGEIALTERIPIQTEAS